MNQPLKSSCYEDLLRELHADIAADLGIDLSREAQKVCNVLRSSGIKAAIRWLEIKLEPLVTGFRPLVTPEYSELSSAVFPSDSGTPAWRAYAHARQLYALFRKLEDVQCSETEEEALSAFWMRQAEMNRELTTAQMQLASELSKEIAYLIPDFPYRECDFPAPDIGPGASYEKRARSERIEFFCDPRFSFSGAQREPAIRLSRACAVPKNWKRLRLIFVEPSSRMLVEKALQGWLYDAAGKYPLGRYVNFVDQTSQHVRLRKPESASIDLSDASDWIDRRIVWLAFARRPLLRSLLFGSRAVGDSTGKKFSCYSTMGNATTFPVMSLLLAAVTRLCESQARRAGAKLWTSGVFGDDIVCHEVIYGSVVCVLRDLGLKVNASKSYVCSPFKEACGLDLVDGRDVTPVKVKSLHTDTHTDWNRLVAYANSLFTAGYWRAADTLVSVILSRWPKTSFGPVGEPDCIWSPTLEAIDGPWHGDWQRTATWVPHALAVRPSLKHTMTEAQLQMWLAHRRCAVDAIAFERGYKAFALALDSVLKSGASPIRSNTD